MHMCDTPCGTPCVCLRKLRIPEYGEPLLTCQICKNPTRVTVCDTSGNGFVCDDYTCRTVLRTLSDILTNEDLIEPLSFYVNVTKDKTTGSFKLESAYDTAPYLPNPDLLAFMFLRQNHRLVPADHQNVVKMCFRNLNEMVSSDDLTDTIYMKFSKPLEHIECDDGSVSTFCHKWHIHCIPGGNIRMCDPIPIPFEGRHRITMEFTEAMRIV